MIITPRDHRSQVHHPAVYRGSAPHGVQGVLPGWLIGESKTAWQAIDPERLASLVERSATGWRPPALYDEWKRRRGISCGK